ncbi:membrane-associated proteins in eicosanoid and glutathione metabolism [Irpex lacteus]|nr:membrane-associated proteins in eicosanoid and glutathione metabolism [Irpex lacteus]
MSGIFLPIGYSYVIASVVSTFYVTLWQSWKVGHARLQAKIEYPQEYAEQAVASESKDAQIFNCTQRAHQHTLEWLPQLYISALVVGLRHPILAASAVIFWSVGRVLFTLGYSTGDPKKRKGPVVFLSTNGVVFGMVILGTTYTAYELLKLDI